MEPSKTLAVYSVSGAISKQEAYRLTNPGGSKVCIAQNWDMVTAKHEQTQCSYSHLMETQG